MDFILNSKGDHYAKRLTKELVERARYFIRRHAAPHSFYGIYQFLILVTSNLYLLFLLLRSSVPHCLEVQKKLSAMCRPFRAIARFVHAYDERV